MTPISYARHRFPPAVIRHVVWLNLRFTLSYRDVEELLAERGLHVRTRRPGDGSLSSSCSSRRKLQARRLRPSSQWQLDEMVVIVRYAGTLAPAFECGFDI
jgi:transposase-like protein